MSRSMVVAVAASVLLGIATPGSAQQAAAGSDRGGFTLLASIGVGYQNDQALSDPETGLAGLNLGIGGWLSEDLVLWFRVSGVTADYGPFSQTSGVGGAAVQYWLNDRFNVEGGVGAGFWTIEDENESGLGLLFAAGYTVFNSGRHNLQIGVEYAPAFTDPETVHNFGVTLGYQLF